jgi:hypothetical protein
MATFIDTAAQKRAGLPVLSSYADGECPGFEWMGNREMDARLTGQAVKTYEMTWAIRWASEKTRRRVK